MFARLKNHYRDLRKGKPGTRFQTRHRTRKGRRNAFMKPIYLVLGALIMLAGIVLLPAPGPGMIVIALGAAMLAQESLWLARALDRLEVKARAVAAHVRGTLKRRRAH